MHGLIISSLSAQAQLLVRSLTEMLACVRAWWLVTNAMQTKKIHRIFRRSCLYIAVGTCWCSSLVFACPMYTGKTNVRIIPDKSTRGKVKKKMFWVWVKHDVEPSLHCSRAYTGKTTINKNYRGISLADWELSALRCLCRRPWWLKRSYYSLRSKL
jgi:hypothetical protein